MPYPLLHFLGSVAAAYAVALAVWPLLTLRGGPNIVGMVLAVCGIAACPLLIPSQHVLARALASLVCVDALLRVADYARQVRTGGSAPRAWRKYLVFLIPFPFLLVVFGQKQPAVSKVDWPSQVVRLALGAVAFAVVLVLARESVHAAALRDSFVLDHCVKLALFVVGIEGMSQALAALERLAGFETRPIIDRCYLARTPAEFWFRFNQRVRQWLLCNVFIPSGGGRSPLRGVAAVCLVSAILHEFFFALATSRLDGYQFAFFLLQAPAILVSPRLARLAAHSPTGQAFARGLTVVWFAITSPLFFHGLDRVFPFVYASRPWLP